MFKKHGDLEYWQEAALAPMAHGFFTRKGGFSKGAIASLNCGYGADEPTETVDKNRGLVVEALGSNSPLQGVHQCHSARVIAIEEPMNGERPQADALVTATPNLPLGILTADCGPMLFADADAGVIGAAHAGWRGAVGGVIETTIDAMRQLGARDITAVLGPTISQNNYEVGAEFVDQFVVEDPSYREYFSGAEKIYFNLPRFILDRCRANDADATWIGECTYADADRYYSYRRATHKSEPDYGRLASAIMIPA